MQAIVEAVKSIEQKYRQRKFLIMIFVLLVITVALFTGHLEGGEFNAALTIVLVTYGTQAYFGSKDDRQ